MSTKGCICSTRSTGAARSVSRHSPGCTAGSSSAWRRTDSTCSTSRAASRPARSSASSHGISYEALHVATSSMKVAVVGGGLAGLAAALDLMDSGVDVTLYEARPTLGGAVQTLPERESDPQPPPDNGQHIALGCFTEYLRFLDRVGEGGSYLRTRLALPVLDEHA